MTELLQLRAELRAMSARAGETRRRLAELAAQAVAGRRA